ncbi:conserved hypothetical protein [Isorropodon fossajaponicum endosymbiont JTNG4]|nr:conserved hypothetical protein [Isorropodon fossajaponicum endosymbiont JTNG4]
MIMKKIFAIVLLAFTLSANAFWNSNNTPWGNNHNGYGYQEDNGMFGYNPYDFWDPRWYPEEMGNMFDEFDNNGWSNNNNYYSYGRNGYGFAPNGYTNTPWGPGVVPNMTTPVVPTAR